MRVEFPAKLAPLFQPSRFKSIRGGRDGGKSWGVARALLEKGAIGKEFIVCARETMESIKDSVHRSLENQIDLLQMRDQYEVGKALIRHRFTGTEFVFRGLKNPDALKSLEGATIAWIEEAQTVSEDSWRKVIPTVRRDDSEIWLTWNPELETDPTWRRFVVNPPPGTIDIVINFSDNPWYSKVVEPLRLKEQQDDPDEYAHTWLGQPRRQISGAVYANEIRLAEEQGRISHVPYHEGAPVRCGWDLGDSDIMAIWFVQSIMGQHRFIDYYENRHQPLDHYLEVCAAKGYRYAEDYFPWDASSKVLAGALETTMRQKGRNVKILPRQSRDVGIDKVREMLGTSWFDIDKCQDGINRLRYYRYGETSMVDPRTGERSLGREPLHDDNSHGCLTGDSLVKLPDSTMRRIDAVRCGDRVWTPAGPGRVAWSGLVKQVDSLIEIETSDGSVLRCTPEHKIFTVRGLIRSDALRYTDSVLKGTEWINVLPSLFSRVRNTGFRATITGATYGDQRGLRTCIGRFGKMLTERFRMGMRSIMSMVTTSTTNWQTCSCSPSASTSACTPLSGSHLEPSSRPPMNAASSPQSGTPLPRGSNGTGSTGFVHGRGVSGIRRLVRSAGNYLVRLSLCAPSSAMSIVSLKRVAVSSESVYDLTVESHACYQANGILVSNSDAIRSFAMGYRAPKPKEESPKGRILQPPRKPGQFAPFG